MQLVSSPTTKSFFWYLTFTEEFQQQMHLFIFFPPTHHCGKMWQAWRTTILQYLQWNAFQSARPNLSLSVSMHLNASFLTLDQAAMHGCARLCMLLRQACARLGHAERLCAVQPWASQRSAGVEMPDKLWQTYFKIFKTLGEVNSHEILIGCETWSHNMQHAYQTRHFWWFLHALVNVALFSAFCRQGDQAAVQRIHHAF